MWFFHHSFLALFLLLYPHTWTFHVLSFLGRSLNFDAFRLLSLSLPLEFCLNLWFSYSQVYTGSRSLSFVVRHGYKIPNSMLDRFIKCANHVSIYWSFCVRHSWTLEPGEQTSCSQEVTVWSECNIYCMSFLLLIWVSENLSSSSLSSHQGVFLLPILLGPPREYHPQRV